MSFLPHQRHSFHITVIPSALLSFLPDYCHSFRIIVIPSILVSFLPNYCHSFQIIAISNICHPEQLQYPPIPEGREKWPPEVAIYASTYNFEYVCSKKIILVDSRWTLRVFIIDFQNGKQNFLFQINSNGFSRHRSFGHEAH